MEHLGIKKNTEKLPGWKIFIYCVGQFGWSLASFGVMYLVTYFYLPPETGEGFSFPPLIFQGAILGLLTVIGLANLIGRIVDAVTDPLIASWSDRCKSKFGRRRFYLMISAFPYALTSFLVFMTPQSHAGIINSVWVVVMIVLFFIFMTMYVVPFISLVAEFGHSSKERLFLSTVTAIAWASGFLLGNAVYVVKGLLEEMGLEAVTAMRLIIGIFAAISFICMILPVIFIDEKRYCRSKPSDEGSLKAIMTILKNRNFRIFICSDFAYYVSNTFLEVGVVYYVTVLLGLSESMTSTLMAVMFFLGFAFYPFVYRLADRFGKKIIQMFALAIQAFVFLMIPFSGKIVFIPSKVWIWMIFLLESLPAAICGLVSMAMISDLARADGITTGKHNEAMFYGTRNFMSKIAGSLTAFVFPSMLLLGRSVENDFGIRLTGIVALCFAVISFIFISVYNEKEIHRQLSLEEK